MVREEQIFFGHVLSNRYTLCYLLFKWYIFQLKLGWKVMHVVQYDSCGGGAAALKLNIIMLRCKS
uniref:Uncharacterized protein n=1 Tax=Solanum lycopersicum TaxID=4081 RepID=A0A3Q7I2B8_SOLLC